MDKTCKRCGESYAVATPCKTCHAATERRYRINNIDKVRKNDRNRPNRAERLEAARQRYRKRTSTPEGRAKEWARKAKNRDSNKKAARQAIFTALRDGKIAKQPCERCGAVKNIHAHHDDYTKPMEVNWFCPPHHGARHREINEEKRP